MTIGRTLQRLKVVNLLGERVENIFSKTFQPNCIFGANIFPWFYLLLHLNQEVPLY